MPNAIVKYAGKRAGGLLLTMPQYKRARTVMYAAKYAYANRKYAYRAARRIQRTYRRYRGKRRGRYQTQTARRGVPSKRNNVKASQIITTPGGIHIGKLDVVILPYPTMAGLGINNDNIRKNNMIRVKGVKICRHFEFREAYSSTTNPVGLSCHWALVQLKTKNADPTNFIKGEFFRDNTGVNTRTLPFVDYSAASAWSGHYNCYNMNPNKNFNILTHYRFTLRPKSSSQAGQPSEYKIEKYFKLARNIVFADNTTDVPNNPVYEIMWWNPWSLNGFPADPTQRFVHTWHSHTLYFDDNMG